MADATATNAAATAHTTNAATPTSTEINKGETTEQTLSGTGMDKMKSCKMLYLFMDLGKEVCAVRAEVV